MDNFRRRLLKPIQLSVLLRAGISTNANNWHIYNSSKKLCSLLLKLSMQKKLWWMNGGWRFYHVKLIMGILNISMEMAY
jgi:hypothetical protein